MIDTSPVLGQIAMQVQSAVPSWFGDGAVLCSTLPEIYQRRWSFMLRFLVQDEREQQTAILVKIARHEEMALEQATKEQSLLQRTEREYEMLSSIERIFKTHDGDWPFCFIRPLALMEQWNALVTEELQAQPLKEHLLRMRMGLGYVPAWRSFEEILKRSARWLRIYHEQMGDVNSEPLSQIGLWEKVEHILQQLENVASVDDLEFIGNSVMQELKESANIEVPLAMLHGDFHCANILVMPDGRVGALDADCVRGPIYEDIAKLIADLETRSVQMLTRGRFIRSGQMQRCVATILDGYFGSEELNRKLLELFTVMAVLNKWVMDEGALSQTVGFQRLLRKLVASWRRQYFSRLVRHHLAEMGFWAKPEFDTGKTDMDNE